MRWTLVLYSKGKMHATHQLDENFPGSCFLDNGIFWQIIYFLNDGICWHKFLTNPETGKMIQSNGNSFLVKYPVCRYFCVCMYCMHSKSEFICVCVPKLFHSVEDPQRKRKQRNFSWDVDCSAHRSFWDLFVHISTTVK